MSRKAGDARLLKTLFRSLVRFTRQPHVVEAKFKLHPEDYGVAKELQALGVGNVRNHYGLYAAISHLFRSNSSSSSGDVDTALDALKQLNALGFNLKEKNAQRMKNSAAEVQACAVFKVGQPLYHVPSGVRCIVVGWDVDLATGVQRLDCVFDEDDLVEMRNGASFEPGCVHPAASFAPLDEPTLWRVKHPALNTMFTGFDAARGRFDPNDDLRYRYPLDGAAKDAPSSSSSPSSSSHLSVNAEADTRQSAVAVLRSVEALGTRLHTVLASHGLDSLAASTAADEEGSARRRAWLGVAKDVMGDVVELVDRCRRCAHGLDTETTLSPESESDAGSLPFVDSIMRPTAAGVDVLSPSPPPRFVQWRRTARQRLLADQGQRQRQGLAADADADTAQGPRGDLARAAASALDLLLSAYRALDQMLQLRFQAHGVGYFETIAHRAAAADDTDTDAAAAAPLPEPVPAVPFFVGQVLRHQRFGYRCAVTGWDQRPLQDVSRWEGVVGTARGRDQPFFRVIPDEDDVRSMLGDGAFRPSFYVAQENLVPVEVPAERVIRHPHLTFFFPDGYDAAAGRFRASHKLRFCFPPQTADAASAGAPSPPDEAAAEGFATAECAMLQMYSLLKTSLARTGQQPLPPLDAPVAAVVAAAAGAAATAASPHTAAMHALAEAGRPRPDAPAPGAGAPDCLPFDALFALLRGAAGPLPAYHLEAAIWQAWMSHPDPAVNQAMRTGVACLRRGDAVAAHDAFQACLAADPVYAEAHNKLAAMYHRSEQYSECAMRAGLALTACPRHFGALAGLGMSREKMGEPAQAEAALRAALRLHPWASHVPTVLWTLLLEQRERRNDDQELRRAQDTKATGATAEAGAGETQT